MVVDSTTSHAVDADAEKIWCKYTPAVISAVQGPVIVEAHISVHLLAGTRCVPGQEAMRFCAPQVAHCAQRARL